MTGLLRLNGRRTTRRKSEKSSCHSNASLGYYRVTEFHGRELVSKWSFIFLDNNIMSSSPTLNTLPVNWFRGRRQWCLWCIYPYDVTARLICVARGDHGTAPQILAYLILLYFERRYPKWNTVIRLKSNILSRPKILGWVCHWPKSFFDAVAVQNIIVLNWPKFRGANPICDGMTRRKAIPLKGISLDIHIVRRYLRESERMSSCKGASARGIPRGSNGGTMPPAPKSSNNPATTVASTFFNTVHLFPRL